jgi:hypothetical protein
MHFKLFSCFWQTTSRLKLASKTHVASYGCSSKNCPNLYCQCACCRIATAEMDYEDADQDYQDPADYQDDDMGFFDAEGGEDDEGGLVNCSHTGCRYMLYVLSMCAQQPTFSTS